MKSRDPQESRKDQSQHAVPRPQVPFPETLLVGPMLLSITAGLLLAMCLWQTFWQRPLTPAELEEFTSIGRSGTRPEYDMQIYVVAAAFSCLLSWWLCWHWKRHWQAGGRPADFGFARFLMLLQIPIAGILAAAPLLHLESARLTFGSGVAGLACALSLPLATYRGFLRLLVVLRRSRRVWAWTAGGLALAAVLLFVFVPDGGELAGRCCQVDGFHHWDYYAMSPALAFRHGVALGTDFYVQYGVGWPIVAALGSRLAPMTYGGLIHMGVLWGCVYFLVEFFFLRALLRSSAWALTGLVFSLLMQLYGGTMGMPLWFFPSATVMRTPVDICVFFACLAYARSGNPRQGFVIGAGAGLSVLFSTETGIYLLITLAVYAAMLWRMPADSRARLHAAALARRTAVSLLVVALVGLGYASRGTLFQPSFWKGWLEAITGAGGGANALPIREAAADFRVYLLLFLMVTCYLTAVVRTGEMAWRRALTPRDLLLGVIALYGMATFLLFVNRSCIFNIFHPAIPLCIVFTAYAAQLQGWAVRNLGTRSRRGLRPALRFLLRMIPLACTAAILVGLLLDPDVWDYPGLLPRLAGRAAPRTEAETIYLRAASKDVPLSRPQYEKAVQDFQAVADTLRELSDHGKHSVGMLGPDDTKYLVEADVRPYFRYSPLLLALGLRRQVRELADVLDRRPPDYLVLPQRQICIDILAELQGVIQKRYELERVVPDYYVLRRRDPTPPP